MKIETDLKKIKRLAEKHDDQNWDFRTFLKGYDAPDDLDAIVHDLYRRVSAAIDCTKCANCCKTVGPVLDGQDIVKCSKRLDIPPNDFKNQYLIPDEEPGKQIFREIPCPLVENNKCSIYSHRPKDCRSYPHLHKKGFVFRLWGVVENCSICPIVYNVYEEMKSKLWHDDYEDDFYGDLENTY